MLRHRGGAKQKTMTEIQADYNYIMRAIDGCETTFQTRCCNHMVQFFEVHHKAASMANCLGQLLQAKSDYLEGVTAASSPSPGFENLSQRIGDLAARTGDAEVYELQENGTAIRVN